MPKSDFEDMVNFRKLEWDTNYFGLNCAKAILLAQMTEDTWKELKNKFVEYDFISIENRDSNPVNSQLIVKDTKAFLIDINVQFYKNVESPNEIPKRITIEKNMKKNECVVSMAEFKYSKFLEDPELAKRGGENVYRHWVMNSFEKPEKYFVLSQDEEGNHNGFILFSYIDKACRIELFAVDKSSIGKGIGKDMFCALENEAYKNGCKKINVGTQLRNIGAINFYRRLGCTLDGCHQIYHLWK